MVWNKDLAKLKQDLKAEEGTEPKRPVPKPAPKPVAPKELEDEDALFLAVMGKRKKATGPLAAEEPAPQAPPGPPKGESFGEAMAALKGVRSVQPSRLPAPQESGKPAAPTVADASPAPEPPPAAAEPVPAGEPPAPEPEPDRTAPVLIQLAAGMAIEVDGTLDLRGHSETDAVERLKERILDGHLMGWRTLHIHLGPSEDLRRTILAFLAGPDGELIARYAQAPIPMGGAQAWILYLGVQNSASH